MAVVGGSSIDVDARTQSYTEALRRQLKSSREWRGEGHSSGDIGPYEDGR